MDFFQAQDTARRRSSLLVVYFTGAVIGIVLAVYLATVFGIRAASGTAVEGGGGFWDPRLFGFVAAGTIAVIGLGSLFKTLALRAGGGSVARSLGGQRVSPETSDLKLRRLLNVVEEMAIASGVRVPEVYVLPESGINAFAAGFSADDAAVAVTQGCLDTLTRDELQGVIAHEFSHILNGDMRLNIRLIGLLFGILLLTVIGRVLVRSIGGRRRRSGGGRDPGAAIAILGIALIAIGYIGVFFGRLIQAAVSRQREFLADASAVQFTRNPAGISGALKKIGGIASGSQVTNAHATETRHMFFASAFGGGAVNALATHPPLIDRIRAIEPNFDGKFPHVSVAPVDTPPPRHPPADDVRRPAPVPAAHFAAAVAALEEADPATGAALIASIPETLRDQAHRSEYVRAVVLAMLISQNDPAAGARQAAALARKLTPAEAQAGTDAMPLVAGLSLSARLALVDLALPSLRQLPAPQVTGFLEAVDGLVAADFRTTPFEFALQHIVRRNLAAPGSTLATGSPSPTNTAKPLPDDLVAVVLAIARAGSDDLASRQAAATAAFGVLQLPERRVTPEELRSASLPQLTLSLRRLDRAAPEQKRRILAALAHAASLDGTIRPDEFALLRAFAAALDCPAPALSG